LSQKVTLDIQMVMRGRASRRLLALITNLLKEGLL